MGQHFSPIIYSAWPQAGETPGTVRRRITVIITKSLGKTSLQGLGPTDFIIVFTLLCNKLKLHSFIDAAVKAKIHKYCAIQY